MAPRFVHRHPPPSSSSQSHPPKASFNRLAMLLLELLYGIILATDQLNAQILVL